MGCSRAALLEQLCDIAMADALDHLLLIGSHTHQMVMVHCSLHTRQTSRAKEAWPHASVAAGKAHWAGNGYNSNRTPWNVAPTWQIPFVSSSITCQRSSQTTC